MRMVLFTFSFAFGVWLLQQQALLPDFNWTWLLTGYLLTPFIPTRTAALRLLRLLLLSTLACGSGYFYAAWQAQQRLSDSLPQEWQGRDIEVIGVVSQLPHINERGQRFSFDVEKSLTAHAQLPGHIYLSTYSHPRNPPPIVHAGERWQLTVRLKQPHGSSNPCGYDFELWALENNIRAVGYVTNKGKHQRIDTLAEGFSYQLESWREAIRDKFNATLGHAPYSGILTALAIGDQGSIPEAQWRIFRQTGVIHLMSISGLHITMLAGIGYALINSLWRRNTRLTLCLPARKAAVIATVATACAYTLLAGYGVPAQRTVYMVAMVAAALWLKRIFSLGQIFSCACLCVLITDPWSILSPGFLLSFGAVALILFVSAHRVSRHIERDEGQATLSIGSLKRYVLQSVGEYCTVQWAMSLGLIPLLLYLFGQISVVSPIANAFAIPLISLIVVPLTLLGAALPTEVPLWLAHIILDLTMIPLEYLSNLPAAVWIQHVPSAGCIAAGLLGIVWILLPGGFPARWLGGLLILPMFLNSPEPPATGELRLFVFDVGQGLSAAIQTHTHTLLYDTGPDFSGEADSGNRILIPSLHGLGINSLDAMILSHDDQDHAGGTSSILQAMPVDWLSSPAFFTIPAPVPVNFRRCMDSVSWNWDGVQFDILHPRTDSIVKPHDNNQSCVLRISTGTQHLLLTGDIERRGEQRLLGEHADQLSSTVLIVPHHGSSGSSTTEFVAAVLPDFAIFTSGYRNRFGHPKEEVQQRYRDSGATLLRSDEDGAIIATINAQSTVLERYRKTHHHYWTHIPQAQSIPQ